MVGSKTPFLVEKVPLFSSTLATFISQSKSSSTAWDLIKLETNNTYTTYSKIFHKYDFNSAGKVLHAHAQIQKVMSDVFLGFFLVDDREMIHIPL